MPPRKHYWTVCKSVLRANHWTELHTVGGLHQWIYRPSGRDYDANPHEPSAVLRLRWGVLGFLTFVSRWARKHKEQLELAIATTILCIAISFDIIVLCSLSG